MTTKPDDVSENNLDLLPDCDPVSVPTTGDTNLGYKIPHLYVATRVDLETEIENNMKRFIFSSNNVLPFRHPGSFNIYVRASYHITKLVDHRMQRATIRIPISGKIRSPDGNEFTAKRVTVELLNRFRDFRGVSQGTWSTRRFWRQWSDRTRLSRKSRKSWA